MKPIPGPGIGFRGSILTPKAKTRNINTLGEESEVFSAKRSAELASIKRFGRTPGAHPLSGDPVAKWNTYIKKIGGVENFTALAKSEYQILLNKKRGTIRSVCDTGTDYNDE